MATWSSPTANLAADYLALNRADEAKKILLQAQERKLDGDYLHQEFTTRHF